MKRTFLLMFIFCFDFHWKLERRYFSRVVMSGMPVLIDDSQPALKLESPALF